MQFSPTSCHFTPLWSTYSLQHPVLKHLMSETKLQLINSFQLNK
jgi:hypothetical protein